MFAVVCCCYSAAAAIDLEFTACYIHVNFYFYQPLSSLSELSTTPVSPTRRQFVEQTHDRLLQMTQQEHIMHSGHLGGAGPAGWFV